MSTGTPPKDSSEIDGADLIYRRVAPDQVKWNKLTGLAERAGKNAFGDSPDGSTCSVYIESALRRHGLPRESIMKSGYGLVVFSAADARACGFGIYYELDPKDPGHGSLTGDKNDPTPRKQLAEKAKILVEPPKRHR